jgi:outer membrane immunogenic protein
VRIAVLAGGIAAAVTTVSTLAQADPVLLFDGGYVGINAGGAWGSSSFFTDPNCPPVSIDAPFCNTTPAFAATNGALVSASGRGTLSPSGFTGGVQAGYDWQQDALVVGAEADFGALSLDKSVAPSGAFPPSPFIGTAYSLSERMSTDWLATLRARLGVAVMPHLLLYATGGVALTDFKFESTYADNAISPVFPGGTGFGSSSQVKAGWVVGGGGEWMLDRSWSVRAEYLYVDFGSLTVSVPVTNTPAYAQTMSVDAALKASLARVGLNFQY